MKKYTLRPELKDESSAEKPSQPKSKEEYFFKVEDQELLVLKLWTKGGGFAHVVVPGYVRGRKPSPEQEGAEILDIEPVSDEKRDLVTKVLKDKVEGQISFWLE